MRRVLLILVAILLVVVVVLAVFLVQQIQLKQGGVNGNTTPTATSTSTSTSITIFTPTGVPYTHGTQIIDVNGHPLLLRGAQIETSFNYIKQWDSGEKPTNTLNSTVFHAMVHDWNMNAFRLPLSNWIYAKDTAAYTSQLDQIVQEANAAGLYVILDLHDDPQAGSPYPKEASLPKSEDIPFWKAIAAHFKSNPMVMFDLYNEPKDHGWQQWLHGGGTVSGATVVGFQDLVNAVRSVGAQQIIVVEPGSSGKGSQANGQDVAQEGGWSTIGNHLINDPNTVYSLHVYEGINATPQLLDAKWGPILNHFPLYYGEWAFLPNANIAAHCQNLPTDPAQADGMVNNFLNYMASHNASWTAWEFAPHYLVQNYATYTPTTLDTSWTCGNTQQHNVGMGTLVKRYLTGHV